MYVYHISHYVVSMIKLDEVIRVLLSPKKDGNAGTCCIHRWTLETYAEGSKLIAERKYYKILLIWGMQSSQINRQKTELWCQRLTGEGKWRVIV